VHSADRGHFQFSNAPWKSLDECSVLLQIFVSATDKYPTGFQISVTPADALDIAYNATSDPSTVYLTSSSSLKRRVSVSIAPPQQDSRFL
jgi:hypothetical protein